MRKLARGWSEIRTDSMCFVYEDELWTFPTIAVKPLVRFHKYKATASIDELRKLGKLLKIKPEFLGE